MKGLAAVSVLLLLACAPGTREEREALRRKPIERAAVSGWARLPLDREAQKAFPDLWLGDAQGASVPFLVERDGLWQPRDLDLEKSALGKDSQGRPTAEFVLKFPQGWQVREREQLRIQLDLEGAAPWVCRVEVERRQPGGKAITLQRDLPVHLFNLGDAGRNSTFSVPWDFQIYRVTLHPAQGVAPRIKGLKVTAITEPSARPEDAAVAPRLEPLGAQEWRLSLEAPDRIIGAEIALQPPVAPISPEFTLPSAPAKPSRGETIPASERPVSSAGLLWNLPALGTVSTRVSLGPVTTDRLHVRLPAGARPESVKLLVRREVLLFPAEAGKAYFLHCGGQVRRAPGNLAALPDSSRAVYQREGLKIGAATSDPFGLPKKIETPDPTLPWLPWVTGLVVAILAFAAWHLLKESPPQEGDPR
jgi:hypothetical protein